MTNKADLKTDVLIVGSGPSGATAALALATLGVDHLVVTRHRWTANSPRAHLTNQRTVEIFRDLGIEADVKQHATPIEMIGELVFCTSLSGDELGRMHAYETDPARQADAMLASPSATCDLPQHLLEPILVGHAAQRGSEILFNTEYTRLEQDEDGVTVTLRDRLSGEQQTVRARYVIGADGARSQVAEDIGLPLEGQMDLAGSMNIVFDADLSSRVAHRPGNLYLVLRAGSGYGGISIGVIRMVRPWDEWMAIWGYDINQPPPELTDERATEIVHDLLGDDTIPVTIRSTSLWSVNQVHAARYREGRVFCVGDAVHRHAPSNGLGSNTSVQDSYNLAWKLAYVLRGDAGPGLLDSFDAERPPVGKQVVQRANQSLTEYAPIFEAFGFTETTDAAEMTERMRALAADTPEGALRREQLRKAFELKNYEFNSHGVELGQRYASDAIVSDGSPEPPYTRDPELYYHPTTWPGAHLPHCWLGRDGHRVSTLDLAGKGRFALLTGIAGQRWAAAAERVAAELGIELAAHVIGPDREHTDLYGEWARLRGIDEDGCVLVRPDAHVAWRSTSLVGDPDQALLDVLRHVLDRTPATADATPGTGSDRLSSPA